eukprot:gene50431-67538_t
MNALTSHNNLKQRALYEEVAELLRQRIFARELEPGSWIDELKLAEEYGISRTPLREALKVLAAEGLVTMKVRRGAYVTEVSEQDLADVYHLLSLLESDAAGVVAPASGEGIYYAMLGGQLAAQAVAEFLLSGNPRALAQARKRFMREHGRVFWILGMMQRFWYSSDKRRERFVSICRDKDVQQLTFDAYMNKALVRAKPMAHVRIFFKDMAHLLGLHPEDPPVSELTSLEWLTVDGVL